MYPMVAVMKSPKHLARCDWDAEMIILFLPSIWKFIGQINIWGMTLDIQVYLFIHMVNKLTFHEYLHEVMKEENEHPVYCNRCEEGRCKLCNLTERLWDYYKPSEDSPLSKTTNNETVDLMNWVMSV